MILVMRILIFILVFNQLLPLGLAEYTSIPLFDPGHRLARYAFVTHELREAAWTISVDP